MDSAKKIAMFCHDDPLAQLGSQESGGQAVYVNSLIKELDKRGWAIDTFTRLDSSRKKPLSVMGKRSRLIRLRGGPAKYISRKLLFDFLPQLYENFSNWIGGQNPYSLFHGHYWDGGWLAKRASRQFRKPLVENFHSLGKVRLETREKYSTDGSDKDIFDKRLAVESEIAGAADAVISLSESERDFLQNQYSVSPEKLVVIPGGVDLKIFSPSPRLSARKKLHLNEDDFILLFAGRLEWRKGIGTLIHAANLLKNDMPNLKILIIGGKIYGRQKNVDDFKEYQRLGKICKDLGTEEAVSFLGCIDHNRLPLFYSAADLFIVPSYYEPFGLVAIESMACRTPVIASAVGGLNAIIENNVNGLLFEARNPVDLKDKILQIRASGAQGIIDNAYKCVAEKYSWKSIAEKISQIYDKLIKDENSPR
ncbi:MAG: glycosyltransferase [Candidatus Nealsonbacteria bacterium]|nr:glycosyltransferase [Candidatus Nealsonbacteria bacterium]